MGFARAASRAFSRITPKAWRGKKKTENFDLPRNHSENKQNYVNLVGSHRDAKGKVRKYDLISDQDTGDLYVANYSAGKTKYIHSGNVIKDHTAVDFGTFENKQRARNQGQYSGLDATAKYLRDNGIHLEGLDRTMGTSKSPKFTGSLIDPQSRHRIGTGYGHNTDTHRNYVTLNPLSDLEKAWRATQNKPGNPPSSGGFGPAPKQPNGPKNPSGPRFNQQPGNPFSGASSQSPPPKPPKNGPSGSGTTFGPVPSQNKAGMSKQEVQDLLNSEQYQSAKETLDAWRRSSKTKASPDISDAELEKWLGRPTSGMNKIGKESWRKVAREYQSRHGSLVKNPTVSGSAIKAPSNQPQSIASEMKALGFTPQTASVPAVREETAPAKKTGGRKKRAAKETVAPTVTPSQAPQVEEAPLSLTEVFSRVKYPHKRMVEERLNTELPSILKEGREDTPESKPLTREEELDLRSHMEGLGQAARDTTQRRVGGKYDPTKSKKYTDESKYRSVNSESDTHIESADALSGVFSNLASTSDDPALAKLLTAVSEKLSKRSANLKGQREALKAGTPNGKKNADELAQRLRNELDPQQIAKESGAVYTHPMKTSVTNDVAAAYAKATGQNNSSDKPEDIRGLGLREFEVPSPYEDLGAKTKDRLAQVPRDFEDDQRFNEFLAGEPVRIGNSKDIVRPDTPLDMKQIKGMVNQPETIDLYKEYADQIAIPLSKIKGAMESQALLTRDFNTAKASEFNMAGADIHEGVEIPRRGNGSLYERMQLQEAENSVYKSESDMYAKIRDQLLAQAPQRLEYIDRSLPVEQQRLLLRDAVSQDLHSELADQVANLRNPEGDTSGKPNVFRMDKADTEGLTDTTPERILEMASQGDPIQAVESYLKGRGIGVTEENIAAVIDMYDKGKLAQGADFHAAALQSNPNDEIAQNLASTTYNQMISQGVTLPGTVSPFDKYYETPAQNFVPPASIDEIASVLPEGVQVSEAVPQDVKIRKGLGRSGKNKPV